MQVVVIGGGAAGFFSAIQAKTNFPDAQVFLLEASGKLLSKVRISGGGRCNVTNGCTSIPQLVAGYPRGGKLLKKAFRQFNNQHTQAWFEERGVRLYTQPDNRVFPVSDSSQTIIDCLMRESQRLGVQVHTGQRVTQLTQKNNRFSLTIAKASEPLRCDKVIVATGGSPKAAGLDWLAELGHRIVPPVPSLFTFNMPKAPITALMGVVAPEAVVSIQSTKLKATGPLLITHWGMSGPAILQLSARAARWLHEQQYTFTVQVNWVNEARFAVVREQLEGIVLANAKKQLSNVRPYELPDRLWRFLLERIGLSAKKPWGELGKKGLDKLTTLLTNDPYPVHGKTTFKEEFVTCGGVSLESIDAKTMESRHIPGLYFAGEVLDIDGITGGYNFQAAWTTGWLAGKLATTPSV